MSAPRVALLALLAIWPGLEEATAQADAAPALANPVAALSLEQLSATRERPLFSPIRRVPAAPEPPPPPVAAAPEAPPPPPTLTLFGIVMHPEGARALVRAAASNDLLRLRLGDMVDGWEVAEIGRTELVLRLGERVETVALFTGAAKQVKPKIVPPAKMHVTPVLRSTPKNGEHDGL